MASITELIAQLHAAKWQLQNLSREVFTELEKPGVRQQLLAELRTDDFFVRNSIAWGLAQVGAAAKPDLLKALHDEDWRARQAAADSLWLLNDVGVVPELLVALHDSEERVRVAAAESLGGIGDKAAVDGLVEALNDKAGSVYAAAIYALYEIADSDDIPQLHPYLTNDDVKLRIAAAYVLGANGGVGAIPALFDVIRIGISGDQTEIEHMMKALVKIGTLAVPLLLDALREDDQVLRRIAISTLGEIGDPVAVPALMEALRGDDIDVQQDAMWALSRIGQAAIPALIVATDDQNSEVRWQALQSLEKIDDPSIIPVFVRLIDDPEPRIRSHALFTLRTTTDENIIAKVFGRLSDSEIAVQRKAAAILRDHIRTPEALEAVEQWRREQGRTGE